MAEKRKTKAGFVGEIREIEVEVPEGEPEIWGTDAKLRVVGTAVPRVDGLAKATGRATYTADVLLPGMLHGRMFRAPAAGGTLRSLDLSAAEKAPGVKYARPVAQPGTRIRHEGRDLAFLVADSEEHLEDALALCRADIEPGPVAATVEDAARDGAPLVNSDKGTNVFASGRDSGEGAFAEAEKEIGKADVVLERTYRTQVQVHSPLEPHAFTVRPDDDGGVTVFASTQGTFSVIDGIAGTLKIPRDKVRVHAEFVGGGFGCKFGSSTPGSQFGPEAARAAVALGAPVRAFLERREEHLVGGNRPSSEQAVKIGIDRDGRVRGYVVRVRGTAGFPEGGAGATNPIRIYELGKGAKSETTIATHAGPGTAFRAPGHPQGSFGQESILDEAADAIGMDPLELRLRLDRNPTRQAQYRLGAERFGWKERRSAKPGSGKGPVKRGVGMGSAIWGGSGGDGGWVEVTVHRDGRVEVSNGAQDIGTGTRTVLAVIAAEVLGLDPGDIQVNLGRTTWPLGPGSGGSTTAPTLGPCARAAAEAARKALLGNAAPTREAWKRACARMEGEKQTFQGRRPNPYRSFGGGVAGVQFAEVEVDTETGVVRVVRVLAIQDCGRVVDSLTAESQVIGGVINGISYALFEDRVLDRKTARLLHGDLEGYRIAGSKDIPDIEVVMFDVANAGNSVGMMGLGEPPKVPTAGAIANAVAHATGARVRDLPITPARVLAALVAKGR